ncbi:MAG: hypothetical protein NZ959_08285 [Armatimonadetes bacterium]|nr:hypothetical protein [Armatimonadota bacterium]MDW8121774.1 hypothetical protein [Armatimonadota bacterium]
MNWQGWLFMSIGWTVIISLFLWSFYKVLTLPNQRNNRGGSSR